MGKVIGIDLGTTNSCVAVMDGGEPIVLPNSEGSRTTPSVVAFTKTGKRLVGQSACRHASAEPGSSVYAVKRLIGRRYDSPELQSIIKMLTYKVVPHENGDAWIEADGGIKSPQEISAIILNNMKETAEQYLRQEVRDAVITCPAYFNDSQRQATRDAGSICGMNILRVINEPTAAALAYGMRNKNNGLIAVFDLGGGTFDITILDMNSGVFVVKATNGDTFLGGEDFDHRVVLHLLEVFKKQNHIELERSPVVMDRLMEAAEKARCELSSAMETRISIPFIHMDGKTPRHLDVRMKRAELEALTADLVERCEAPCRSCMADAGIKPEQLDEIILVGGMTRMPLVQQKVRKIFGKEPNKKINPDEVVSIGAAIQGGVLGGDVSGTLLLDVTPLSLGVETEGGLFTRIIERNTTIPVRRGMIFSTTIDNQPFVDVHVLQGERELARDNKLLGCFQLLGIPPASRGVPQIEVAFDIDADGIVQVSAKDMGTGKAHSIRVTASSGLSRSEIEGMVAEAEARREEDARNKELVELRNSMEGLIYTAKRALDEYSSKIGQDLRESLFKAIIESEKIVPEEDADVLKAKYQSLEEIAHRVSAEIYGWSAGGVPPASEEQKNPK